MWLLLICLDGLHREHFHLVSISIDSKPRRLNGQRGWPILHQEKKWKRKKRKLLSVIFEKLKTHPTQNVSQSASEGFTAVTDWRRYRRGEAGIHHSVERSGAEAKTANPAKSLLQESQTDGRTWCVKSEQNTKPSPSQGKKIQSGLFRTNQSTSGPIIKRQEL